MPGIHLQEVDIHRFQHPTVSICLFELYRISRIGTADIALGHRGRHGAPGTVLLLAVSPAALPHVCLALVDPGRVVHDPAHDGVGVDPAAA